MIGVRPLIGAAALLLAFNSALVIDSASRLRIDGAGFTDWRPRSGGGFRESAFPAPVVSVMSLANEQPGRVGLSGASEWSDTGIRTGPAGDLPPGLALVVVSDSRGALTATVIALPAPGPDAR